MSGDHNINQNDFNPDWLCTCGDLTVLGVVHRKGSSCYYPDKREFVGLTDDDIALLRRQGAHSVSDKHFRAIEAKLKEKQV